MARLIIGDLISFSYPAVHKQGTRAHDKNPKVLVFHPNWQGLVHGLNFNYLSDDEINTIRMILDPTFETKYREQLRRKNRSAYDELERILGGKEPHGGLTKAPPMAVPIGGTTRVTKITSPRAFYYTMIRPFIFKRGFDPYRKYKPHLMTGVRTLEPARKMLGQESLRKFRAEQGKAADDIARMIAQARTQEEKDAAQQAMANLQKAKTPQEKESVLQWFKSKFQHFKGPRF